MWGERVNKRDAQEFERGRIVLNRLLKLAQRERPFRVIERVADGRGLGHTIGF
jgi:hypothetical protein